jgi:hypothetical protein
MRCRSCTEEKPVSEFYASNQARCKECIRLSVRNNRLDKIDYYRQYDRTRSSMPHRLQKNKEIGARWRATHPKRRTAQVAVNNAVRDGRLVQLPCLLCGGKSEAHHVDYDAPLQVVWLCPAHHKQAHAMARAA